MFPQAIQVGSIASWGRTQLIAAFEAKVRATVEANHASEFADAGLLRRLLLRHKIER
jgi:hypothetical protein